MVVTVGKKNDVLLHIELNNVQLTGENLTFDCDSKIFDGCDSLSVFVFDDM